MIQIRPNPGPQEFALSLPDDIFEILYGGSRGGGKTFAGLLWLTDHIDNPKFRALVIRKNADDLSDWIDRAGQLYKSLGAKIAYKPAIITFPSGAVIRTGHLKDDQAYTKYQGHEYQRIVIEELTQIPTEKRYLQLISSCRSTVPGIKPQVFLTSNPGGVGNMWVKERFIDVCAPNKLYRDPDSGRLRIFIPATIDDNPVLMQNDPGYVGTLEGLKKTDEQLYKAWRWGSWDVFIGQAFSEFMTQIHVKDTFPYKLKECRKIISYDWGYNDPGAAHFIAIGPENRQGVTHIWAYREIHQNKTTPEKWADMIDVYCRLEEIDFMVLPHDCFADKEGKNSIAHIFKNKLHTRIVRGDTLSRGARQNRIALTHQYLSIAPDGEPYMTIHPNCKSLIKTLPTLVYDETNPEEIDSDGDDHDFDSVSLGVKTINEKYAINQGATKQLGQASNKVTPWRFNDGNIQSVDIMEAIQHKRKQNPEVMIN